MPLRPPSTRPNFDYATTQRRRNLKTPSSRNKEAERILNLVLRRNGGKIFDVGEGKSFGLDFCGLGLANLPCELFEDEFLHEKCEKYLVALNVAGNNLKSLDVEIGDFANLKSLDCSKNK